MNRKSPSGFTLVEILVTLAIIGLLAAVAVPAYQSYVTRSRVAEALEFADAARVPVELALANATSPATDLLDSGGKKVDMMTAVTWNPGKPGSNLAGYVLAEMDLPGIGVRKVLALERGNDGSWHCTSAVGHVGVAQALEPSYLPSVCRDGAMLAKVSAPGSASASAPAATACAADQEQITTQDSAGKPQQVCAPRCAAGQKRDPGNLASCIAATTAAVPPVAPSQPAAPTPGGPTVTTQPSRDNNPCGANQVFIPDGKGPFTFDGKTPVPGQCKPKSGNMPDPYATVECSVCKVPNAPGLCMFLTKQTMCAWPNNVCINEVTNSANGSKVVDRRCGAYSEASDDWWHSTSDNPDCQDYKPNENTEKDIYCVYACTTPNCNNDVKPAQDSLWIAPN